MRIKYLWSVLLKNGDSKMCKTDSIDNIINYSGIDSDEIIAIVRMYDSYYEENEEWIWC